jgi:hypothetical protein
MTTGREGCHLATNWNSVLRVPTPQILVQNDVGRRQDRAWSRFKEIFLEIRVGYELIYDCPQQTPMMLVLHIHYSRASDIIVPDHVTTTPSLPMSAYRDGFGNWCTRLVAPAGSLRIASAALVRDTGEPDIVAPYAQQHSIQELPEESLVFLLGSPRGRDAIDVAIATTFGPNTLVSFKVWTDEMPG